MSVLPSSVSRVIEELERLPGVGPKSAARMAYFFLRAPKDRTGSFAEALITMKNSTVTCSTCFNISDADPCSICADPSRRGHAVCVVEEPLDVVALEQSGVHRGVYFVLGGAISPADGIGPEELRMHDLQVRLTALVSETKDALEVVIATNPSLEGEATASYVVALIDEVDPDGTRIVVTRLAMGLPTGADLEYADRLTLKRAMEGRTKVLRKKHEK